MVVCAHGLAVGGARRPHPAPIPPWRAAATGATVVVAADPDPAGASVVSRLCRVAGPLDGALLIPIRAGDQLVGMIELARHAPFPAVRDRLARGARRRARRQAPPLATSTPRLGRGGGWGRSPHRDCGVSPIGTAYSPICLRRLCGRMSVHTSLTYARHSAFEPCLPVSCHPAGGASSCSEARSSTAPRGLSPRGRSSCPLSRRPPPRPSLVDELDAGGLNLDLGDRAGLLLGFLGALVVAGLITVPWTTARCPDASFGTKKLCPAILMCACPTASAISIQQPMDWQTAETTPSVRTSLGLGTARGRLSRSSSVGARLLGDLGPELLLGERLEGVARDSPL